MSGYIGSKSSVTQVDGYNRTEADAEFVQDPNGAITVSGSNVGIGTSLPERTFHVNSGNTNAIAVFESTDSFGVVYLADSGSSNNAQVGIGAIADDMILNAGGATAMRIDSSGSLLVGTASTTGTAVVHIPATGSKYAISFRGGSTTSNACAFYNSAGGGVGEILIGASSTTYSTSSDYRLKTDAQPMTGASARVQALKPVNFEWISTGERVDGFLAHEAQAVVPECVTGTKDAMMDEEYEVTAAVLDDDGNETTAAVMGTRNVPDYQGIDQSKLVPLLTAALQEALNKIDTMETRLAALEGN